MKKPPINPILMLVPIVLLGFATTASLAAPTAADDLEAVAGDVARAFGWPTTGLAPSTEGTATPCILGFDRVPLVDGVAHYSVDVRIGSGPYDVLRLHRVVRERRPYKPIRTDKAIFLLHGDLIGFVKFIYGTVTPYLPDEQSLAIFLAQEDIDVWGIDQPWALVPESTDYAFAADWGMQFNVDSLRRGLMVARFARLVTGNGFDKLPLLGYSSGGFTAHAYLNEESQRPCWEQHVSGLVVLDSAYKLDTADPNFEGGRQNACANAMYFQSLLDIGEYNTGWGGFFVGLGELAETAPDDDSPFFPGLTNLEAALTAGAGPSPDWNPWYHFVAGVFEDGDPVPVDLRYTSIGAWLDFIQTASPFEPVQFVTDYYTILCDETEVPFDDHLGEITVPVLYLGAAGGFGEAGFHTLDLLGSTDKTIVNVSLYPPELLDFAHIDLMTADNTVDVVWPHLLTWLEDRCDSGGMVPVAKSQVADADLRVTPNPGRASHCTFSFAMPVAGEASVDVYDVAGRRVATPLSGQLPAGRNEIVWDLRTADGARLGQGVYFVRLRTPEGTRTEKLVNLGR